MRLFTGTSRREFLKQSLFASTVAMATPCFVPRHVLGFAGSPNASEQIVVGVVGVGVRGKQLIGTSRIFRACELVRDGGIGKLKSGEAVCFGDPTPIRPRGFRKSQFRPASIGPCSRGQRRSILSTGSWHSRRVVHGTTSFGATTLVLERT